MLKLVNKWIISFENHHLQQLEPSEGNDDGVGEKATGDNESITAGYPLHFIIFMLILNETGDIIGGAGGGG